MLLILKLSLKEKRQRLYSGTYSTLYYYFSKISIDNLFATILRILLVQYFYGMSLFNRTLIIINFIHQILYLGGALNFTSFPCNQTCTRP